MAQPNPDDPERNANANGGVPWARLLWQQSYGEAAQPKATPQAQAQPEPEPQVQAQPQEATK